MRVAGIDIGSRCVKLVLLDDGEVTFSGVRYNSHNPMEVCEDLLRDVEYEAIGATGYGRHLFRQHRECHVITEIRAVALGGRHLLPSCGVILDIGGQDTKAVSLNERGAVSKFEMNDKCAAGTGRFLEVMAAALAYSMDDFVSQADGAERAQKINSMCTVFAESEVISMVARGIPRHELALGIHQTVARRSVAMLKRVPLKGEALFCGGVALNSCMVRLIEEELGTSISVPDDPQTIAALGCALSVTGS